MLGIHEKVMDGWRDYKGICGSDKDCFRLLSLKVIDNVSFKSMFPFTAPNAGAHTGEEIPRPPKNVAEKWRDFPEL